MKATLHKLILTIHISTSVGWIGVVLGYLTLAVMAMADRDEQAVRVYWMGLEMLGWYVTVPLAIIALHSGLVLALGTRWKITRYYWVLTSLILTSGATAVLLVHMPRVSSYARAAVDITANVSALRQALWGELLHTGLGLVVLLGIEVLNVYKPGGLTPWGRQVQVRGEIGSPVVTKTPWWVHAIWIHAVALVLALTIRHLTSSSLQHHWSGGNIVCFHSV